MHEIDLETSLGSLSGADPSEEFVNRLREQFDAALADGDRRTVQHEPDSAPQRPEVIAGEGNSESFSDLDLIERKGSPEAVSRRLQHLALAAAAVVVAIVGVFAFVDRETSDGVQVGADRSSEIATELLSLAEDVDLTSEQRLGLIAEAFSLDNSEELRQVLGGQLKESGLLVQEQLDDPDARSAYISADGRWVSYTTAGRQMLWDVQEGGTRDILDRGLFAGQPYQFSIEGNLIGVGVITDPVLDPETLQIVEDAIRGLAVPGESVAVSGYQDMIVYDAATGDEIGRTQLPFEPVGMRASVDAEIVVAGQAATSQASNRVVFWDRLENVFVDDHPLESLAATDGRQFTFSPNGQVVAVGVDQVVTILEMENFAAVRSIEVPAKGLEIEQLSFTEDGETLVVISGDEDRREVVLLDASSGELLLEPIPIALSPGRFPSIEFGSGQIVVGSADGSGLEVLTVDPARWMEIACDVAEDPLTGEQRLSLGIAEPACNYA